MENKYYVYILYDPRNNLPFYIGKGTGNRYLNHEKQFNKQLDYKSMLFEDPKKMLSLKEKVFYDLSEINLKYEFKLIEGLNEDDAFLLEHALIAWFGRQLCGNGILTNILSGGRNNELFFDEQMLLEIYKRSDLLRIVTNFQKKSINWIAKSLYFHDSSLSGYPFKELNIDWLHQYHGATEQFAIEVIKKLDSFDSVITPFYWIRKMHNQKVKEDKIYIMNESLDFIKNTHSIKRYSKKFEENKEFYRKIKDMNI